MRLKMTNTFTKSLKLPEIPLWDNIKYSRKLISFDLEITARCNNNCRHCYINLPAGDKKAKEKELSLKNIKKIIDQAAELGALWCLITGGEPLLRKDFSDIYVYLKKKGLLVSVFTNASLITQEYIDLFKKYPPRDIEVTVYGITRKTYEQVTGKPGSFDAFMRGLDFLLKNNIKVGLKAMALRSNVHELSAIAKFCKERSSGYFRFDPFLHLRFDGDKRKNSGIISERLSPKEIIAIEINDTDRFRALKKECGNLVKIDSAHTACGHLFYCGAGNKSFTVSYDGFFRLCSSLWHPECVYDLKKGALLDAWLDLVPKVRGLRSKSQEFLKKCYNCKLINLCMWCPAHAYLETGKLDKPVEYFCSIAKARAHSGSVIKND